MSWSFLETLAGLLLVAIALFVIYRRVTALTLGPNLSRATGTVIALGVYCYFQYDLWPGAPWWVPVVVLGALGLTACIYAVKAWKTKEEEFHAVLESSGWLVGAIAALAAGSYLLSL